VTPHTPQLSVLDIRSTHDALHAAEPVGQLSTQEPRSQKRPAPQDESQLPQWRGSVKRGTQRLPHKVESNEHWQVPLTHAALNGHVVPQVPQFFELACRSAQAPAQSTCSAGHDSRQVPAEQAVAAGQGLLQFPQWIGSLSS
jgi:hypothetical protein